MRHLLVQVGILSFAALLAGCDTRSVAQVGPEEAVLCPGGGDCPEDGSYVGLLMPADSFVASTDGGARFAQAPATAPVEAATAAEAESVPAALSTTVQPPPPPPPRPKKLCPQGGHQKCDPYQSGIDWETEPQQIQCDASRPCVPGKAHGGGNMRAGYIGWLCKKSRPGDCADIPQRRP